MKSKIYIEMGQFIQKYSEIKDDAFCLELRKNLRLNLQNLSSRYNVVLLTSFSIGEVTNWLKKYHFDKFFTEYCIYSTDKAPANNNSISYYIMDINLIENLPS